MNRRAEVIVVGSGAGGAVTALELAQAGRDVLVLEEGLRASPADYGLSAPEAMARLYRRRGMMPIVGRVPIAYVEGRVVGGSTEINSGFWHRTPPDVLARWRDEFGLAGASEAELAPHFAWAEELLGVGRWEGSFPASTQAMWDGATSLGWKVEEIPRMAPGCRQANRCASGCPTGAKQGMSRSLLPRAEKAGARILSGCRVERLVLQGKRVTGVDVVRTSADGSRTRERLDAAQVVVCAGPTETPALLRRSGLRGRVGDRLLLHPMLKVAALFDREMQADRSVLPLVQVREFAPRVVLGGSYVSPGHLAALLGDSAEGRARTQDSARMAAYYVAVHGEGRGSVRPALFGQGTWLRYDLSDDELRALGEGLSHLSRVLLAGGAREVFPAVHGIAPIRSEMQAIQIARTPLSPGALSLSTVHAFSTCATGERADTCPADSFGRVRGYDSVRVNDASMLPDAPGVNPQGTIMALARRNARMLLSELG